MIYIITNILLNSGVFTWNKRFSEILTKNNIKYSFLTIDDIINDKYKVINSIIIINNIKSSEFMNDNILYNLSESNKLYFVIHGDICPINKLFTKYEHYFFGVISISKKMHAIISNNFIDKHVVYIPNKIYLPVIPKKEIDIKNINLDMLVDYLKKKISH